MRVWFSGPRVLGVRPGISLGPEDMRKLGKGATSVPPFIQIAILWGAMALVSVLFHDAGASWLAAGLPTLLVSLVGAWAFLRF